MSTQELHRRSGTDADLGITFEWDVTALAYLRCVKQHEDWKKNPNSGVESFTIANNLDHVGIFDDVAVQVRFADGGEIKSKLIFVQCKHAENPRAGSQKSYNDKYLSDDMIKKYIDSFVKILHIFNDENDITNIRFEEIEAALIKEIVEKDKKIVDKDKPEKIKSNIIANKIGREEIRNFFRCKFSDCEFLFYSNVIVESLKLLEHNTSRDITCEILNTSDSLEFEDVYSKILSKSKFEKFKDNELTFMQENFRKMFRIFVNQSVDVSTEIKQIMKSNVDVEIVTFLFKEEIDYIFRKPIYTALSEESELLHNVECFCKLKLKSASILGDLTSTYGSKSFFSDMAVQILHDQMQTERYKTIKTPHPILENLKLMQLYLKFLNEKGMFVFLKEEENFNTWMCARKINIYKNLKTVLVCSEVPSKMSTCCIEENEMTIEIEHEKIGLLNLEFSEETEKLILNSKVNFQGFTVSVYDICGDKWCDCFDENLICDILKQREIQINDFSLTPLDFYLERRLKFITVKSHRVKQLCQNLPTIESRKRFLVFSEKEKQIPGYNKTEEWFENLCQARLNIREIMSKTINDDTIHFSVRCGDELEVLYSFGEYADHAETKIGNEDDVLRDNRKISILTGLPGIGKSTTLKYLALKYKKNNPSHWVHFIELSRHLDSFRDFGYVDDISSVLNFVATELLKLEGLEFRLFVNACIENGKVALFCDAFDEISPDAEREFSQLLLTLENTKIARIFVSSRPSFVHKLESCLLCHAINFESFDSNERESFLLHYWKKLSNKKCASIATKEEDSINAVQNILNSIGFTDESLDNLLAIPLQMRMLAEIYFEAFNSLHKDGKELDNFKLDVFNLYENFITLHAKRYLIDKLEVDWKNKKQAYKTKAIDDVLQDTEKFSFNFVFFQFETLKDHENESVIVKLRDQLGLITNSDPPVFLHRTFAEFLAAKYIVKQMYNCNDTRMLSNFETVFLDGGYSDVRKFINAILHYKIEKVSHVAWKNPALNLKKYGENGNNAGHIAAFEGNTDILRVLLWNDNNSLEEKNLYEETILHAACRGNKTETVVFLVSEKNCLINVASLKSISPIHYASENGNHATTKLLLEKDITLLNIEDRFCRTPLLLACQNNKTEVAKYLLNHKDCKINIKDVHQRSPLHYASGHGNIELIKSLLALDHTLLNEQDCDGQTPLHHALEKNKSKAATFLIENDGCAVNIGNGLNYFPIHFAAKNGDIDCIDLILKRDHTQLNILECSEKTPLFIACIANKTESVRCLLSDSKCAVKIDDSMNICILTFAVRDENIEIIQFLLERDPTLINQGIEYSYSPLHVACSLGKTESTKCLLAFTESFAHIGDVLAKTGCINPSGKSRFILEIFRLFLEKQSNIDLKELQILFVKDEHEALNFLLEFTKNCPIDVRQKIQFLILQFATIIDDTEIINRTLQQDLTLLNKQNEYGQTILHLACEEDKAKTAECLLTYPSCEIYQQDGKQNYPLHYASKNGRVEIMQLILERDHEQLNKQNGAGDTPLHLACKNNKTEAVKQLISCADCQVNMGNKYRNTPLNFAAINGNIEIIMLILKRDVTQINIKNSSNETPLLSACKNDKMEAAKYILTYYSNCEVNIEDGTGNNTLSYASTYGNTKLMKLILDREHALLNKQNHNAETPLHLACQNDKTEAVTFLLNYDDCSVDLEDNKKHIPIHHASINGNLDIIQLLLKRQTTLINKKNHMNETPLHLACIRNKTEVAKYLVTNTDCSLDLEDDNLNHAIHYAAMNGNLEVMKLALERDHRLLNKQNGEGRTPLHYACIGGSYEAVQFLLSLSNCIKFPADDGGNTVFHLAAMGKNDGKNIPVMSFFLNQDPLLLNLTNKIGRTALHYAASCADNSGIKFLMKCKDLKMNVQDTDGDTPLHVYDPQDKSLTQHSKHIVELMVNHDSTVLDMKNKNGHTPIHTAVLKNHLRIYRTLIKLGANICFPATPDVPWDSYQGFLRLKNLLKKTAKE